MNTLCESYKAAITLTTSTEGASKTVLTYEVALVAKSAAMTAELNSQVRDALVDIKLPHLQQVTSPYIAVRRNALKLKALH